MATLPISEDNMFAGSAPRVARLERASGYKPKVLEQGQFLHLLCWERKRAERSGRPFMLMSLSGHGVFKGMAGEKLIRQVREALAGSSREIDSLGWYKFQRTLGLLLVDIGAAETNATLIAEKIKAALRSTLDSAQFEALEIVFRVFPGQLTDGNEKSEVDLLFYPDSFALCESKKGARLVKRALDVIGSLLLLSLLWPLLLLIALLVKATSQGPILFCQSRVGQHGRTFSFLKFRSMYHGNDPSIHRNYVERLIAGKSDIRQRTNSGGHVYKLTDDPRITPLGRLLRRTSLDELPQLLNVVAGDMSLVGPRPPLAYEFERYSLWHRRRVVEVKPGITGLWQVMGRSKTSFEDMVRLDLAYARAWSLRMDLKILWRTPIAVIRADGAY